MCNNLQQLHKMFRLVLFVFLMLFLTYQNTPSVHESYQWVLLEPLFDETYSETIRSEEIEAKPKRREDK